MTQQQQIQEKIRELKKRNATGESAGKADGANGSNRNLIGVISEINRRFELNN